MFLQFWELYQVTLSFDICEMNHQKLSLSGGWFFFSLIREFVEQKINITLSIQIEKLSGTLPTTTQLIDIFERR